MGRIITPIASQGDGPGAGLFNVARRIDASDSEIDWAQGWPMRTQCPTGGYWCCADDLDPGQGAGENKADPNAVSGEIFQPFLAYQVMGCEAGTSRIPAERRQSAEASDMWLAANIEGWVSMALEIGVCGNTGLVDLVDITAPGGAQSIEATVALLLRNRRQLGMFDKPTIHIPDWYSPVLDDNLWINRVAFLAFGPGYGVDPSVATASGEAWVYITGPVEYSLGRQLDSQGRVDDAPSGGSLDLKRQNRTWDLSEQLAIYRFDPCGGFRALVAVC